MGAYMVKNKEWCNIPDDFLNNFKENTGAHRHSCASRPARSPPRPSRCSKAAEAGRQPAAAAETARRSALIHAGAVRHSRRAGPCPTRRPPASGGASPAKLDALYAAGAARPPDRLAIAARALPVLDLPRQRSIICKTRITALLLLFFIGAIAMRGAGSTFNDLIDRKIDAKVERTRRPPAAVRPGQPARRGGLPGRRRRWSGSPSCCRSTVSRSCSGLCSLVPVAVYPFMKRFTSWPQAVLGLAFSWGALIGWAARDRRPRARRPSGSTPPASSGRSAMTRSTPCRTARTTSRAGRQIDRAAVRRPSDLRGGPASISPRWFCAEIALLTAGAGIARADRPARLRRASGLADAAGSTAPTKPWRSNCSAPTAPAGLPACSPACSRKTCCFIWSVRPASSLVADDFALVAVDRQ